MLPMIHTLHERTGRAYRRLLPALGLARSSVYRWRGRIQRGRVAVGRRGPAKGPVAHPEVLDTAIAGLRHGARRTRGTTALWRQWSAQISRRDFAARVKTERQQVLREARERYERIVWKEPGAVWAMDPAYYKDRLWNMVSDLPSRFRFELYGAWSLPAAEVVQGLERLFARYPPPLVLKRDNGSNLVADVVDEMLEAYGVIGLTSPCYYPRYNGAIEYAQRETKETAGLLEAAGAPRAIALTLAPEVLNTRPRPCLGGRTAQAVWQAAVPRFEPRYPIKRRKEIRDWINECTENIVGHMKDRGPHAHAAARRQAIEACMLDLGIIERVQPKKVLPQIP
jgi:hypothetical protein